MQSKYGTLKKHSPLDTNDIARRRHPAVWAALAALGAGLIFFSSTTRAGRVAGRWFDIAATWAHRRYRYSGHQYLLASFLAEKGVHVALFAGFGIVLSKLFRGQRARWWKVLATGFFLGAVSEWEQRFFISRDPTVRDALLNAGGICLGALLCRLTEK